MSRWQRWRRFLLVWLGSSLLCVVYAILIFFQRGIPNWLDAFIFAGWVMLVGRRLDAAAKRLSRHRVVRWMALIICTAICLFVLLWVIAPPVDGGLWEIDEAGNWFVDRDSLSPVQILLTIPETLYVIGDRVISLGVRYQEGPSTIFAPLRGGEVAPDDPFAFGALETLNNHYQAAKMALGLGLGVSGLALIWRVTWRTLLGVPLLAKLWAELCDGLTALRRTRAWRWLRRGLT